MEKNREFDLSVSCYGVIKELDYQLAVVPWGATEPHNFHLPYLTDAILSHDVSVDAAKLAWERYGVRVMVMPWIAMGSQNPGQRDLKFCVHTRQETQKAILTDIVSSLYHQGLRRIIIINGHGGNLFKGFIRDLSVDYPDLLIASSEWYKVKPANHYFEEPGDHADELETSVMMYYHPELVNIDEAGEGMSGGFALESMTKGSAWLPRNWLKVSKDTGIGSPLKASVEKGKKFVEDIVKEYALLFRDFCKSEDQFYKELV